MPESAIINKLSLGLPQELNAQDRHRIGTKCWATLSRGERRVCLNYEGFMHLVNVPALMLKEIQVAFQDCDQIVQKSPDGSPVNFISNVPSALECWVDASTVPPRIAVIINNFYVTFRLLHGWDSLKDRHNNWAETVGIELVARCAIALGYSNVLVRVRTDSQSAVQMFSDGHFKHQQSSHESVIRLHALLKAYNIRMEFVHVSSKDNIADAFTRGKYDPKYHRAVCNVPLPEALISVLEQEKDT